MSFIKCYFIEFEDTQDANDFEDTQNLRCLGFYDATNDFDIPGKTLKEIEASITGK